MKYKEKIARTYQVVKLTYNMIADALYLPDFLQRFTTPYFDDEDQDGIVYHIGYITVRANHGQDIIPKLGDYLGVNSDGDLRYWSGDDFLDFFEPVDKDSL